MIIFFLNIKSFLKFSNVFLYQISFLLKNLTGVGIGVGIAWSLKLEGLKMISAGISGGLAAYFGKIAIWDLFTTESLTLYFTQNAKFQIGDPLSIYFVVIGTILLINIILKKKTPVDIIIIPL